MNSINFPENSGRLAERFLILINQRDLRRAFSSVALTTICAMLAVSFGTSRTASGADEIKSSSNEKSSPWNPKAAAAYLDQRERWWMGWQDAAREHGTFCISCHTSLPYALARPALRDALGEKTPSELEVALLANAAKRVRMWKELSPVYNDKDDGPNKSSESRSTEAVLLAFTLASNDARSASLSRETRMAFENLWALQRTSGPSQGAWLWQLFDLNPWEGNISAYNGATIAAIAAGSAPGNYRSTPEIQENLKLLRDYLDREYDSQPLINRLSLLWAAAKWPGLATPERRKSIVSDILSKQQADGGWSLFPLTRTWRDWGPSALVGEWKRRDGSPQEKRSDGFATGFVVYVLQQAGVPRENASLERGRQWLIQNQDRSEGFWVAYSLNKRRDPNSNAGRFMTDAATAYSVLALTDPTK
jgi:squalene-hopene/tetraprenyl-beta-curcumene cyclase